MNVRYQILVLSILFSLWGPSAHAYPDLDSLLSGLGRNQGEDQHAGFLGVMLSEVNEETAEAHQLEGPSGVLLGRIMPDLAGAVAGLQEGDVVLEWNGLRVVGVLQFKRLVRETPPGRKVAVKLSREGEMTELSCIVGSRAEAMQGSGSDEDRPAAPWQDHFKHFDRDNLPDEMRSPFGTGGLFSQGRRMLGVMVLGLETQLAEYLGVTEEGGVLISSVQPESVAEAAGLKAGDVILKIDGQSVYGPADVSRLVNRSDEASVELSIIRDKKPLQVSVELALGADEDEDEDEGESPEAEEADDEVPEIGEGADPAP